jgi:hypothetical protein
METMTQPLKSGTPGRSEMSHGKGLMTHPDSDYQSQRQLHFSIGEDENDVQNKLRAEKRTDPTNGFEIIEPDMYFAKGNPDMFGPQPAMVRESAQVPPAVFPQPVLRYGVDREE